MGKTRAEIQRAYRERKKEKEGESYADRERKRIRKYYVPIVERTEKEQKARRDKVRKNVQEHRMRKLLEKKQNENSTIQEQSTSGTSAESDQNGVSSSTPAQKLVVKMPGFDTKQRTRKRVSRAVSKQFRQIQKLREENNGLQKKYKRVSKRYERLFKKDQTVNSTPLKPNQENPEKTNTPEETRETITLDQSLNQQLTPRKRVATELKEAGVSPSKIPRKIKKTLLLGNVITQEIDDTRKHNGRKGRKILASILSGKLMKKYKLKTLMNKYTGINRKVEESVSKKCDYVPKQEKQPLLRKEKRDRVVEFLQRDDNSRMMPGKNDKIKVDKLHLQKRVLNDNMRFLHMKYLAEEGDSISFATFCRMRPKSICLTRYITKNQCLCQRHQNMALTLKSIRSCGATIPLNPDEFVRKLDEDADLEHDLYDGLPDTIRHEQWKKVTLDDGKKRTKVVGTEFSKLQFIKIVQDQIKAFIEHIARVKQQYRAIGNLKQLMPEGHVISQMDFAENFSCGTCDEVQSAYWNSSAVTLHPVVVYFRESGELKHYNYVFVSDELGHNIGTVFAIMKQLIPEVKKSLKCNLKKIHYWTDGPSSQYRNKTAFYIVSNHQEIFGTEADWNYFESGHGKGACDGVGGTAKRMADLSIKQGKMSIQEATDFYKWGQEYHKSAKYILVSQAECADARKQLDEINENLCPVKGTLQVHHVTAVSRGKVKTMTTSCYCEQCLKGDVHTEYNESTLLKNPTSKKQKRSQQHDEHIATEEPEQNDTQNLTNEVAKDNNEKANVSSQSKETEFRQEIQTEEIEQGIQSGETEQGHQTEDTIQDTETRSWKVGDWISVIYEEEWHIGQIVEVDLEEKDCCVSFMRRDACQGSNTPSFKWPNPVDEMWVKFERILLSITEPSKIGRSGRKYSILSNEMNTIKEKME